MLDICLDYIRKWLYKKIKRPADVYEAISPIIRPCYFLGLSPYIIKKYDQKKNSIHYSKWANIFAVLIAVTNIVSIMWNAELDAADFNENFKQKLMYYQEMAAGVFSLCGMMMLCLYSKKLMEIFPSLNDVDESIKVLLVWIDHRDAYLKVLTSVILLMVYIILDSVWLVLEWRHVVNPFFFNGNKVADIVKLFIPYFITIIMEILYCQYISLLRSRFMLLNVYLETLIPRTKSPVNGWTTKTLPTISPLMEDTHLAKKISKALDPVFIVNYVAALHMKLTDCAHLINKAFALQQLLKLAITFVSIVSALYFIAIHFSNPELRSLDILFVMWALSNAMEAVGIVYVTSETCEEANTCPRILHKIRNNSENAELQNTIEIYSLQMYHNRLIFSVLGLFPLDYSLLYTMAAGVTTYLVILIQFNPQDFSADINGTITILNRTI